VQLLSGSLSPYPCLKKSTKYFSHQFSSSNFALWGAICYTSKLLTTMMTYCRHYVVLQVSHIGKVSQTSYCYLSYVVLSNDIIRTLKTPQRLVLKKEKSFDKEYKSFAMKKPTQKSILEGNAPLYTVRECQHSLASLGECCNALCPILGERYPF
jgi:hypothetical protein